MPAVRRVAARSLDRAAVVHQVGRSGDRPTTVGVWLVARSYDRAAVVRGAACCGTVS